MVEGLIGRKIGMTQVFGEDGTAYPVTVIQAGPCTVIQKKAPKKDGGAAVQIGFVDGRGVRKPRKPELGHFKKAGVPVLRHLREVPCSSPDDVKEGDPILVDIFSVGEKVRVTGTSKGKGFAGVMKRHNFRGGEGGHGSMFHRRPGSIGASSYPSRVIKGMRMPGQMGNARVTVKNLVVLEADTENNLLVVKGAVPGAKGAYLMIRKAHRRAGTAKTPKKSKS